MGEFMHRAPGIRPAAADCLAQRPLRVIRQPSQPVEQLMLPLPDGTQLGVRLLRALRPLTFALHVPLV